MKVSTKTKIKYFIRKNNFYILLGAIAVLFVLKSAIGPKTVASGNGYSHQIGSFGKCDVNFDDCTNDATHRRHHFFGNEDYCEACWDRYGQDMFDRLSDTQTKKSPTILEYDEFKCRHVGCDKKAKNSDWSHRFCSEHIQGTTTCRHPTCDREIPITQRHCSQHD